MSDASYPTDLRYTAEHEWVKSTGEDTVRVGITAFAQEALGDVVYVSAPSIGDAVTAGDSCGEVESTKSVSDLFSPATGTVLEVNAEVLDEPGRVNSDPYAAGWLFVLSVESVDALLDAAAYEALTEPGA